MWKPVHAKYFALNHLKLLRISISGHALRISCFGTFRRATFYVYIFNIDSTHLDVNIKGYYLWLHALMKTLTAELLSQRTKSKLNSRKVVQFSVWKLQIQK